MRISTVSSFSAFASSSRRPRSAQAQAPQQQPQSVRCVRAKPGGPLDPDPHDRRHGVTISPGVSFTGRPAIGSSISADP